MKIKKEHLSFGFDVHILLKRIFSGFQHSRRRTFIFSNYGAAMSQISLYGIIGIVRYLALQVENTSRVKLTQRNGSFDGDN